MQGYTAQNLRNLFEGRIKVEAISSELECLSPDQDAQKAREFLRARNFDTCGIQANGRTLGYIHREDLGEGVCEDYLRRFEPGGIVSESTPLLRALGTIAESGPLFVLRGHRVDAIVTEADLQKPPVRMMLFGMVSLLELHLTRIIRSEFSEEEWKRAVSEGRLDKARNIQSQRRERNQDLDLLDCLQLCDKREIIVSDERMRERLDFDSKNKAVAAFKDIERLRDQIAHSQDLFGALDLGELLNLINQMEDVIEACESIGREGRAS